MLRTILILICFFQFLQCNTDHSKDYTKSNTLTGKVIKIIDGDTYDVLLDGNHVLRIRMNGIDAPERGMSYYKVSKNYLSSIIFQKKVRIVLLEKDQHDRWVADTYYADSIHAEVEMIRQGLAWHFKKYSSDEVLANAELDAKLAKRGLWADVQPSPPWEIRSKRRLGMSAKDSVSVN